MAYTTIAQLRRRLEDLRAAGSDDDQLAETWRQAAATLPDPSAATDLAHHQLNALAHQLGIAEHTAQWWRVPTDMHRFVLGPADPQPLSVPWSERYYKGYAIVSRIEGEGQAWHFVAYSLDPGFQEVFRCETEGLATLADAYEAAIASQVQAIDAAQSR